MSVREYIYKTIAKHTMHMALLDPDKQSSECAADMAFQAQEAGTDAIMIGGSTGVVLDKVDEDVRAIKKRGVTVPVILFPSSGAALSENADAMYFMSLMNSRKLDFVIREHAKAAPFIKQIGLETVSMGYIVVEPGGRVGEVGEADLIPRDKPEQALGYAIAAELFGMDSVYLEAGSGAKDPVPPEMISLVKAQLDVPLFVGGGIRTPEAAARAREAGADIVITGTVVEDADDITATIADIIAAVRG